MPVVDASVWVALHHGGDRWHASSVAWLTSALIAGERLVAPMLVLAEVAAALRRRTGEAALPAAVVSELLALDALELVDLDEKRAKMAAQIASTTGIRAADAVYVALARELSEPLITLDREQHERGAAIVEVRSP